MSGSANALRSLLRRQHYRCRLCQRRLVHAAAVLRWRKVVDMGPEQIAWTAPDGRICSALFATRDHMIPRRVARRVGHNSQALCAPCHHRKSAVDAMQFSQPPDRYDFCVECRRLLSWGPSGCSVCHVYRGAPLVAWLVRTSKVRRG